MDNETILQTHGLKKYFGKVHAVDGVSLKEARKAARGEAVLHPRVAARLIQEVQGKRCLEFNPFTELTTGKWKCST